MYNFHFNEKNEKNNTICIFLTINFCENLQEYIFVQNQFLIIKHDKMNKYHQCWQKKKADKKNPLFKENVSDCKSVNIDGIYLFYKFL